MLKKLTIWENLVKQFQSFIMDQHFKDFHTLPILVSILIVSILVVMIRNVKDGLPKANRKTPMQLMSFKLSISAMHLRPTWTIVLGWEQGFINPKIRKKLK